MDWYTWSLVSIFTHLVWIQNYPRVYTDRGAVYSTYKVHTISSSKSTSALWICRIHHGPLRFARDPCSLQLLLRTHWYSKRCTLTISTVLQNMGCPLLKCLGMSGKVAMTANMHTCTKKNAQVGERHHSKERMCRCSCVAVQPMQSINSDLPILLMWLLYCHDHMPKQFYWVMRRGTWYEVLEK